MIRQLTDEDYKEVASWWNKRGSLALPRDFLPEESYIVHYGEHKKVLAVFIYLHKSKAVRVGWMAFPVSNPDKKIISPETRAKAWQEINIFLESMAKNWAIDILFTASAVPGLTDRLEEIGFINYEKGSSNLFKRMGME